MKPNVVQWLNTNVFPCTSNEELRDGNTIINNLLRYSFGILNIPVTLLGSEGC